jgi:dipeptidyl aminopeptidase/acylaminoacyl peptidase
MKNIYSALLIFCFYLISFAQEKKALDHSDYASWNSLSNTTLSDSGNWVSWQVNPQQGDGICYIRNIHSFDQIAIMRGSNVHFLPGEKHSLCVQKVAESHRRDAIRRKLKPDDKPRPSLVLLELNNDLNQTVYPDYTDLKVAEYSLPTFAFRLHGEGMSLNEDSEIEDSDRDKDENTKPKKLPKEVATLYVHNPLTFDSIIELGPAGAYKVSKHGDAVLFARYLRDSKKYELVYFDVATKREIVLLSDFHNIAQLAISPHGTKASAIFTRDTLEIDDASFHFEFWQVTPNSKSGFKSISFQSEIQQRQVSPHASMDFNLDASFLYFGLRPKDWEVYKRDTSLLDEDIASLDVWTPYDHELQTRQKNKASSWKKHSEPVIYQVRTDGFLIPETDLFTSHAFSTRNRHNWLLISRNLDYAEGRIYTFGRESSYEALNLATGEKVVITERSTSRPQISPQGNYAFWYDEDIKAWRAKSLKSNSASVVLGRDVKTHWHNLQSDIPNTTPAYGAAGFTEDEKHIWLYDEFDIWIVDPNGRAPSKKITRGKEQNKRFRYTHPNFKIIGIQQDQSVFLTAFCLDSLNHSLWEFVNDSLYMRRQFNGNLFGLQSDLNLNRLLYRTGTFNDFPDLYSFNANSDTDLRLNQDVNPQKEEYFWGQVEQIHYVIGNNDTLKGLLYRPERIKGDKAPLIVYFYERNVETMHRHIIPTPSRSIINFPYYLSNGYAVFVPDIVYDEGKPGSSAYDCIMSGVDKVLAENHSWIDSNRMALNGQSWGGYQTAWLVTQTDRFKAAFSGAPVSNMTSAYGGIRWNGGFSRIMQYEAGQSRLGDPMHDNLDAYLQNSPVFYTSRVNTPLLIMHNDNDGAVPWYQGIELYMSLIRQQKPVWMLVYNNEEHNLTKWPNRMDLSQRVAEFYDYYLMGGEMPKWMRYGVPIWQKPK